MILKNLFRRKGRTLLTLFGISIGVAAIIALGAMAAGMREGYSAMATGSEADLVLTQESAMDVTMGGLDESVGDQLLGWPEVDEVDGALVGNVQAEDSPYFYIFGYDPEGFAITHFRIVEGQTLEEAKRVRGKPLLLGRSAAGIPCASPGERFASSVSMRRGLLLRMVGRSSRWTRPSR
jgi:putative ABC transport system permease protein